MSRRTKGARSTDNSETNMVLAILFLMIHGIASTSQPSISWDHTDWGETAIVPMKSAPFPHESRKDGFKYQDKQFPRDPHYIDNSVGLFIPRQFSPDQPTGLLICFHGWDNNVRKALDDYHLREQIARSGKNIILIFPEGPKDASDSGGGRLEE